MKKTSTLLVLTLSIASYLFSQAPQGINYQSVIRDGNGAVRANQSVGIKINIHQGASAGTTVYSETFPALTTNQVGLLNLVIGRGTVISGAFDSIGWSANTFYAEILLDSNNTGTYISMGTQQMISVPYALFANKANESQTLSISGNNLSISSGNTVTLPTNSGGSSIGNYVQTVSIGTSMGSSFITATSEPNVDSFIALSGSYSAGYSFNIIRADNVTNVMEVVGQSNASDYNGCANPVVTSATTYHNNNQVYCLYSNLCGPTIGGVGLYPNNVTIIGATLPTSGSNGLIFTDGTYMFAHNNGTNWIKFSVSASGDTFTNAGTLILQSTSSSTKSVCFDGTNFYALDGFTLYKMDGTGNAISSKKVYGSPSGLANIDATRIYVISATQVIDPAYTSTYALTMTPVGKP